MRGFVWYVTGLVVIFSCFGIVLCIHAVTQFRYGVFMLLFIPLVLHANYQLVRSAIDIDKELRDK